MNTFQKYIVTAVRALPDVQLLELVQKIMIEYNTGSPPKPKAKPTQAVKNPVKFKLSAEFLVSVEKFVHESAGVARSDVAKHFNIGGVQASRTLRKLREDKRIFACGDRRFTRYAKDLLIARKAFKVASEGA